MKLFSAALVLAVATAHEVRGHPDDVITCRDLLGRTFCRNNDVRYDQVVEYLDGEEFNPDERPGYITVTCEEAFSRSYCDRRDTPRNQIVAILERHTGSDDSSTDSSSDSTPSSGSSDDS